MAQPSVVPNAAVKAAELLIDVLSDTYVLAVKTHGYHWNVTGPLFPQLHKMFGEQYEELIEAADSIAERIRGLDLPVSGSMESFLANSEINEATRPPGSAADMIKDLLESHEILRKRAAKASDDLADIDDVASEDLMIERLRYHDKVIWMLRSQVV